MKAILEDGGVPVPRLAVTDKEPKRIVSYSQSKIWHLVILNMYLNAIGRVEDADSLREQCADVESELHMLGVKNPYYSGFTEDGFGVYNSENEQIIFVECETDLEV